MTNSQKGFSSVLVILVIFNSLFLVVGGFIYLKQLQKIQFQSPEPSLISSSQPKYSEKDYESWLTYKNTKYGYEIKYPPKKSNVGNNTSTSVFFNDQVRLYIFKSGHNKCGINDFYCRKENIKSTEDLTLPSGLRVRKLEGSTELLVLGGGYYPPESFIRYEFNQNNLIYQLDLGEIPKSFINVSNDPTYPSNRTPGKIEEEKFEELEKMVLSFRFLEDTEIDSDLSKCIENRNKNKGEIIPGDLIIVFQDYLTEDDITEFQQLLSKDGLQLSLNNKNVFRSASIKVPSGQEVELACRLENNVYVNYVDFNRQASVSSN